MPITSGYRPQSTSAQWVAKNPTLRAGVIGIEIDTGKWKRGDGMTAWNDLGYDVADESTQLMGFDGDGKLRGAFSAFGTMTADPAGTVDIITQNVWEEVLTGFITGELEDVVFDGSHTLTVGKAGRYLCTVTATLQSTNNEVVGAAVAVNGMAHMPGHGHTTIAGTNDNASMSQAVILPLSAGDAITVAVVNHGSATDLDVVHCSVSVVRV